MSRVFLSQSPTPLGSSFVDPSRRIYTEEGNRFADIWKVCGLPAAAVIESSTQSMRES